MATKIIDASAVAAIAFVEPGAAEVLARLQGQPLAAPALIRYELANVCLTRLRKNPQDERLVWTRYASIASMAIDMHDVDFSGCVELGRRFALSAYDASYLWLARALGAELVTLDQKLARAAAAG